MTVQPGSPEYYHDDAGEVRWRVKAKNGEITEASTEGFVNLRKAFDNYTLTRSNVQTTYEEAEAQLNGHTEDGDGNDTSGETGPAGGSESDDEDGDEEADSR